MGMLVKYLTIYLMNCILWGTRNIRRTFNFLGEPDAQCTTATLTKTVPTTVFMFKLQFQYCIRVYFITSFPCPENKKSQNKWLVIFIIILCLFATVEPLYVVDVELCGCRAPSVILMLYCHLVEQKRTAISH